MTFFSLSVTLLSRILLVLLFMPFSALDKLLDFRGAVAQAAEHVGSKRVAGAMIVAGLFVEVVMSLGVLTGVADRLCAFILAGYCLVTAVVWKRFWATGDLSLVGPSKGRDLFWDFLKNLAVAGGFLLITFGGHARGAHAFLHAPLSSTEPYKLGDGR